MSGQLEITSAAGLITVQDGGRPGHLHQGVPAGGALVPELLARANRAVGNAPGEAALEVFGRVTLKAIGDPLLVALDDGIALSCTGLAITQHPLTRVRYLAIRGGLDVPEVLGGRGTLLVAALGGHLGRPLRRGDRLSIGARFIDEGELTIRDLELTQPIKVRPGPDLDRFTESALETLFNSEWILSPASDRTGTRLIGPALGRSERDAALSTPMVPGAIQVPASGAPIVLGPDHPTTGGYPLIGVVLRADLGRFAARKIGAEARFVRA